MKINFNLEYQTTFGERVALVVRDEQGGENQRPH